VALEDLVEETVVVAGTRLRIARPRDSEALIDEHRFEDDEFMPYWAELWPSAVVLAEMIGSRALRGARTLELGCGLGLVSVAAAGAGARVTATDWSAESLRFTERNAALNGVELETLFCDWAHPSPVLERAPWDLVLASDVLYEARNCEMLAELLPRLGGEVLLADPDRLTSAYFFDLADGRFSQRETKRRTGGVSVTVYQLRAASGNARRA
jgi:predicted nicotinamide N-methyase